MLEALPSDPMPRMIRAALWYEGYGALRLEDAPLSLILLLAVAAGAIERANKAPEAEAVGKVHLSKKVILPENSRKSRGIWMRFVTGADGARERCFPRSWNITLRKTIRSG